MSVGQSTIQLPFTTSHAFIIGIDDYQHVSPLSTAVNDAKALAVTLTENHGYRVHPPLLNATKTDILQLLEDDIPQLVGEQDRVFFYFAGHGIALDSDDNPKGYLVPADARPGDSETLVSMDVFHEAISKLPCQHGMLILDCCFAGAFKWSTGFRDVVFDLPGIIYEERFYQYAQDPAWQVITSSAADQKAVDILSDRSLGMRNTGEAQHSPFALALLEGLAGEADTTPKIKGDGVITATELYTYLRDRVEDETTEQGKRQSPSFFSLQKHDKGQYIFIHPRHPLNLPPIPKRNPFMGLRSYNEDNASLFYGRDRVIEALHGLTQDHPLIVVSGASGTGKSSVIKAGLLPLLRKQSYQILPVLRPGKEPLESLQLSLSLSAKKTKAGTINYQLPVNDQTSVLLIDQYEELITQCLHEEDRYAFEQQLADWIRQYPQLRIIISVRADFEPQFVDSPLADWWQAGRYTVPAFNNDELREVIIKPTIQEVLFFEPDSLVDQLVDAVNQAPGALPLLSFTLSELYHMYLKSGRTNRAFIQEDYDKLGGVIGALSNRANAIYEQLDTDHQRSMQKLMLHMISLTGGEAASSRVQQKDLIYSSDEETQRIQLIAQQMVDARLLSTGIDQQGKTYYEPAHDALVRAWDLLWGWIKKTGEVKIRLMNKLSLAVEDYSHHKEEKGGHKYLWHNDPRLNFLLADLLLEDHSFNKAEEEFIRASRSWQLRNKRGLWAVVAVVIVGLASLSAYALYERRIAENQAAQLSEQREALIISNEQAESARHIALVKQYEAEGASCEAEDAALVAEAARLEAELAQQAAEQALVGMQVEILKETSEKAMEHKVPRTTALVGLQVFLYNYEHPTQGDIYESSVYNSLIKGALELSGKNRYYIRADYSPIQMVATHPSLPLLFTASEKTLKVWEVAKWNKWGVPTWKNTPRSIELFSSGSAKIIDVKLHPQADYFLLTMDDSRLIRLSLNGQERPIILPEPQVQLQEARWINEGEQILAIGKEQSYLYTKEGNLISFFSKPASAINLYIPPNKKVNTPAHLLSISDPTKEKYLLSLQALSSSQAPPKAMELSLQYGQFTAWDYFNFSPDYEFLTLGTQQAKTVLSKRTLQGKREISIEDYYTSLRIFQFANPASITSFAIAEERALLFVATDNGQLMVIDLNQFEKEGYQAVELKLDNTAVSSLHYNEQEELLVIGKADGSVLFFHYNPMRLAQCICEQMKAEAVNEQDPYFDLLNSSDWNNYFQNLEQRPPCGRVWSAVKGS